MKKFLPPIIMFLLAIVSASCLGRKYVYPDYPQSLPSYEDALDKYSGNTKMYQDFETKVIMSATMQTAEFRKAYTFRYCRVYLIEKPRCDAMEQDQVDAAANALEFFLSFYTTDPDWNDLNQSDSLWKLYLSVDGAEEKLLPTVIEKVFEKEPYYATFYPYVKPWHTTYRVRFPLPPPDWQGKELELIASGPIGQGVIEFEAY